jgi:hypothetical protein
MTGHYDALAFGGALFLAFLVLLLIVTRTHHRRRRAARAVYRARLAAERQRHQHTRVRDRRAYWKLHATFTAYVNGAPITDAELHARLNHHDEPIPYIPVDGCTPVWTTGAAPEAIDDAFDDIMRGGFLGGES